MLEFVFLYQLARNPLRAFIRRWMCRNLGDVPLVKRQLCPGRGE